MLSNGRSPKLKTNVALQPILDFTEFYCTKWIVVSYLASASMTTFVKDYKVKHLRHFCQTYTARFTKNLRQALAPYKQPAPSKRALEDCIMGLHTKI